MLIIDTCSDGSNSVIPMFLGPLLKAKMMQGPGDPFLSLHRAMVRSPQDTSQLIDLIVNACVQYEQYGGDVNAAFMH